MERRSTGVWITGIVLTVIGGGSLAAGSLVFASAGEESDCPPCVSGDCACDGDDDTGAASTVSLIVGAVGLGAGIPMILWGGKKVPVKPAPSATLLVGPGSLSLRGRF
jgi:hypothetical protein